MLSFAEGRAISMCIILTLLNSMKLSVYPPFPMFSFNLLFSVIVFALLLHNSVCVIPQYEACQNQKCGSTVLVFPFRTAGCGLKDFQIDCVDDSRPVLQIDSTNYTIIDLFNNQTIVVATDSTCLGTGALGKIFNVANCFLTPCAPYEQLLGSVCSAQMEINFLTVHWSISKDIEACQACENSGGYCVSNSGSDLVCLCKDGNHTDECPGVGKKEKDQTGAIIGGSVGGVVGLAFLFILSTCFYQKKKMKKKNHSLPLVAFGKRASTSASKVEKFLQDFTHEMPTRYSYSQLKKITNSFAEKLGEGGFGVVYKGKLTEENLVAVKILDQSRHSEIQFMNEVATIGRIHHFHLVRLLGYCFEGSRSALVYEYMPNGSLEKFVYAKKERRQILSAEQLYSIALGAARGIAYLHQDCEKRIIHFDIKPHNILLDADFTPKISDFGLAKLCGRLDDHISVTAARGTPGYVAPEIWSRDLGPITEKADVYSFGMVLLEMAGGRKNIDVQVNRSSELYFPDWAFKHLEKGELEQRLRGRIGEETGCENDILGMKMCKVGLWCIQYKSMDRPAMNRVVQMLEGSGDEVRNPPFPFNPLPSTQPALMSCSEESSSIECVGMVHCAPAEEAPVLAIIPSD